VKTNSSNEVSAAEGARTLQIELDYFYRLLRCGKLAGRKVGKTWRIPVAAIEVRKAQLAR
jgi:excisionase family DNA binding protein